MENVLIGRILQGHAWHELASQLIHTHCRAAGGYLASSAYQVLPGAAADADDAASGGSPEEATPPETLQVHPRLPPGYTPNSYPPIGYPSPGGPAPPAPLRAPSPQTKAQPPAQRGNEPVVLSSQARAEVAKLISQVCILGYNIYTTYAGMSVRAQ